MIKLGEWGHTPNEIRDKLGIFTLTLYDIEGNCHFYRYDEGFVSDSWYIDKLNIGNTIGMNKAH